MVAETIAYDDWTSPFRRKWFVLHVKPRCEKKVFSFLQAYGYFRYLPTYRKTRIVQRRKVHTSLPLFPGYVFTRLLPEERMEILRTNLIVRTIFVNYPREMVHQLRQIARAAKSSQKELRAIRSTFRVGDYIRVKYGPFAGVEGYIRREGAKATLCMNIDILGASVEVALSPADIEKKEPPK